VTAAGRSSATRKGVGGGSRQRAGTIGWRGWEGRRQRGPAGGSALLRLEPRFLVVAARVSGWVGGRENKAMIPY
jgi:hypothetical protein